jgi:hypothetical protein
MVAAVSIPTVLPWRFEEVLNRENMMRTRIADCQAAAQARLTDRSMEGRSDQLFAGSDIGFTGGSGTHSELTH